MEIQEMVNNFWTKRSDEFNENRVKDLKGEKKDIWKNIITDVVKSGKGLKALDIGSGPGFLSSILWEMGFDVTGIDYSEKMIKYAKKNAKMLGYENIQYLQMDAQNLEFEDETFDFIISRNVTWTLPDPEKAYIEWSRVLKKDGIMLNFDGNYGTGYIMAKEKNEEYLEIEERNNSEYDSTMTKDMIDQRNEILSNLYISKLTRPQWDINVLFKNGISKLTVDLNINDKAKITNQVNYKYNNVIGAYDMFMIYARK